MVGMLPVSRARAGRHPRASVGTSGDTVRMPGLGLEVRRPLLSERGRYERIAGTASADMGGAIMKEHFRLRVEMALLTAYNASIAPSANPIIHADIEESANPTIAFPVKTLS